MSDRPVQVLAVTGNPEGAAFANRVGCHIESLKEHGVHVEKVAWSPALHSAVLQKMAKVDLVWWHRLPVLPWRWRKWRRMAKRLLFDLDSIEEVPADGGWRDRLVRWSLAGAMKRSDLLLVASEALAQWVEPLGVPTEVVGHAVALPRTERPSVQASKLRLFWSGTPAQLTSLESIRPALEQLGREQPDLVLRLVCDRSVSFDPLPVEHVPQSDQNVMQSLAESHVGLWPLDDVAEAMVLCPEPIMQCMAHGMAWVGTDTGQIQHVCEDGFRVRGLTAGTPPQWIGAITRLVRNRDMIHRMGLEGRAYIERAHAPEALVLRLARSMADLLD